MDKMSGYVDFTKLLIELSNQARERCRNES